MRGTLSLAALAALACAPASPQGPTRPAAVSAVRAHPRASVPVTLRDPGSSAGAVVEALGAQAGLSLSADAGIADSRLTVLVRARPLAEVMEAVARLCESRWDRVPGPEGAAHGFRLVRRQETAEAEAGEQARYRKGRDALAAAQRAMVRSLIDEAADLAGLTADEVAARSDNLYLAVASQDPVNRALFGLLGRLGAEERGALAESALQPTGTISATDWSHYEGKVRFVAPFESLPAAQQAAIGEAAGPQRSGDLQGARVGVVGSDGDLRLGVSAPGGFFVLGEGLATPPSREEYESMRANRWAVRNGATPPFVDWSSTDARRALELKYGGAWPEDPALCDVRLDPTLAAKRVRTRGLQHPQRLETFLAAVHDQLGVPVYADGFLHNSRTNTVFTLQGKDSYTVQEAMEEMSRVFKRRIRSEAGGLVLRSRRPAISALFEVSEPLLAQWRQKRRETRALKFDDYAALAGLLSSEQLETLEGMPRDEDYLQQEATTLRRYLPVFRLWNSLDAPARRLASSDGLQYAKMTAPQRLEVWRIAGLALPVPAGVAPEGAGVRFNLDDGPCAVAVTTPGVSPSTRTLRVPL